MFGFHDHIIDKRSGRPGPHSSWIAERFHTWALWFMAALSIAVSAYFLAGIGELKSAAAMALIASLFAAAAYLRQRALQRKWTALYRAIDAYEAILSKSDR